MAKEKKIKIDSRLTRNFPEISQHSNQLFKNQGHIGRGKDETF